MKLAVAGTRGLLSAPLCPSIVQGQVGAGGMKRFLIERDRPSIDRKSVAELRAAAQKANQVIAELAPDIQ
ncbi:MAG: hypothetical protein ACREH3_08925, partial [Geminicoccales bacterium]